MFFVGDGSSTYKDLLEKAFSNSNTTIYFADEEKNIANSVSIATAGYVKYKNGDYGDSNMLSPIYLRKSQAERALEEKNN